MAAIAAQQAGGVDVVRFLDLIAWSERTSTHLLTKCDGYDVIVTSLYGPEVFTSFATHPFMNGRAPNVLRRVPLLLSTAAGRYQILLRYWLIYKEELGLSDFSPVNQDLVAIQMMKERHAPAALAAGDVALAIARCSNIWASFPGNTYNQNPHKLDVLLRQYSVLSNSAQKEMPRA